MLRAPKRNCCGPPSAPWTQFPPPIAKASFLTPNTLHIKWKCFNEKITGEVKLGGSRQDAVNFLAMIAKGDRQLEVGRGRTAWLDAIVQARRQFVPGQFSDAICVITDGHDNSSKIDADVVRKELQAQNVRLFGFVIEAVSARTVEDEGSSPSTLRHLALATGGNVISLAYPEYGSATVMAPGAREPREDTERLLSYARTLAQEVGERYDLTVSLPELLSKPQPWKLEVVDPMGAQRKDLILLYPHEFRGCHDQP